MLLCMLQTMFFAHAMENREEEVLTAKLEELVLALKKIYTTLQPAPTISQQPQEPRAYKIRCKRGHCHFKGRGRMGKGPRGQGHRKQRILTALEKTPAAQSETPSTFKVDCNKDRCRVRKVHRGHRHGGKGHHHGKPGKK